MANIPLGCDPAVGALTPSKKREYRVTDRIREGKRTIYVVVFNFIHSRSYSSRDSMITKMNLFTLSVGLAILMDFHSKWLEDLKWKYPRY